MSYVRMMQVMSFGFKLVSSVASFCDFGVADVSLIYTDVLDFQPHDHTTPDTVNCFESKLV